MKIAIIPARGGSKRIPGKNIKSFNGTPIIGHVIQVALQSGCFDRVIVSTDDNAIAQVALEFGAEVPFVRPAALADDYATTGVVIEHAITWLESNDSLPEYLCVLYATAPFVTSEMLNNALTKLESCREKLFCFGVTEFEFPIQRAIKISPSEDITMFQPEHFATRSQDLEKAYHDAGLFYWGRTQGFISSRGMFSADAIPHIIPHYMVQDIDTEDDWVRAELMFLGLKKLGML